MRAVLIYFGLVAAVVATVALLAQIGEDIRAATPVSMHEPLWMAGAVILTGAVFALVTVKVPPFAMSVLAWRTSMYVGIAVGLLTFCFYVTGECKRSGRSFHCTVQYE